MRSTFDRRRFLCAAGTSVALPLFVSTRPRAAASRRATARCERLVVVGNPFGMYPPAFHPEESGRDYALPALLEPLARHRRRITVFSHLDHGVGGGHAGAPAFASGVRPSEAGSMPEGNVTIDQKAAEHMGARTRLPVLNLGVGGTWDMCWTRDGVRVPPITNPRKAFDLLFVSDEGVELARRAQELEREREVLDAVRDEARRFQRRLGAADREKFEEYVAATREVEARITAARHWLHEPKPTVALARPTKRDDAADLRAMFQLIALALQTDSTRVATLEINGSGLGAALGLRGSYHLYSHHGMRDELLDGLLRIERFQMVELARFLDALEATPDPLHGGVLLDHTMVLFGSGLGNGNSHSCRNLPLLLAGGPFPHGRHLDFPAEGPGVVPMCNLLLTMLRAFGLEVEQFGASTGTLAELSA